MPEGCGMPLAQMFIAWCQQSKPGDKLFLGVACTDRHARVSPGMLRGATSSTSLLSPSAGMLPGLSPGDVPRVPLSLDTCQRSELAPKKIDKTDAKEKWGSAGFASHLSLKLSVMLYGADALTPSFRMLPVTKFSSSLATLQVAEHT
ncbi:hypothetical protein llap_16049 [Limosa lapponica baueri]|uniref:Uncharacterized protein n=1 Tax=Limosa lapponica baueri TaxID=1758121 RepID=A0A2I0TIJ0_LIMLA|nr:hypothetical protein llap_16049 [Limosa lapponica baueri]